MRIAVNLSIVLPGRIVNAKTYSDYPVSETVIIGNVPESYTYIDDTESSVLSKINDYAEYPQK